MFDEEADEIVFKLLSRGCKVLLTGYDDGNGNVGDQEWCSSIWSKQGKWWSQSKEEKEVEAKKYDDDKVPGSPHFHWTQKAITMSNHFQGLQHHNHLVQTVVRSSCIWTSTMDTSCTYNNDFWYREIVIGEDTWTLWSDKWQQST